MVKLVNFGNGGFDLESVVNSQINVVGDSVRLPRNVVARDKTRFYYGRIINDGNSGDDVSLVLDGKYDLGNFRVFDKERDLEDFLRKSGIKQKDRVELKVKKTNPGQGALNAAYAGAVFQQGNNPIDLFLVSNYYSAVVKNKLPSNLKYKPVCKKHGAVPTNVNIKIQGKKLTFRTPIESYCGIHSSNVLDNLISDDAIFIDSVKDNGFLDLALKSIVRNNPHVYVSATESMVKKAGKGSVWILLKESEVYIAGFGELELLTGDIEGYDKLKKAMALVQSRMKSGARVYVTDDDKGSYVFDENGNLYHHPVAKNADPRDFFVKNTSGCGDAFAAIISLLELARLGRGRGYSTAEILGYAGIAGQINARLPTTCSNKMATKQRINNYLTKNPEVKMIREYDGKEFVDCMSLRGMK